MNMNKSIICFLLIGCIFSTCIPVIAENPSETNEKEYWGIVIVSLAETLQPYIYDGLIQSNNWDKDHLRLLWKEQATRKNILSGLDWLQNQSDENDIVFFSVDSHGVFMQNTYGIWPWDGNTQGMITIEEIDNKLDTIESDGMCLIFDCCLSGTFIQMENMIMQKKSILINSKQTIKSMIVQNVGDQNRVIIMSTQPNGLGIHWLDYNFKTGSYDIEISPSSTISECLKKGYDPNSDTITSAEEIFQYLKFNFRKYALRGFLSIPIQVFCYLSYGFFTIPFPTIYDSYMDQLPIMHNS